MKISTLLQRIIIALLIIVGATTLSSFIIGQYDPNQWPDAVRLSFGIGVILTVVVIVMHHKAQERQKIADKKKEEAKLAALRTEQLLREREKAVEVIEKEKQHQDQLLNGPAFKFANDLTSVFQKKTMETMVNMNTLPAIPPTLEEGQQ